MNIAIIAWGSLIHNPGNLNIIPVDGHNWHYEGPFLPIEFKRISRDGRLTLVISPGAEMIKTFYAVTTYSNIQQAISTLAAREGCPGHRIGTYNCDTETFSPQNFLFKKEIRVWCQYHNNIDAVL